MKPELKRKWVKALLSGEYEQGGGYLRSNGRYCCLGVLAEVTGFQSYSSAKLIGKNRGYAVLGLNYDIQWGLADLNDAGVPFDMIAGLIDEAL